MNQYNLQVEILKELKEQMMDNPSLFTAGLLVSQTELALDMQTKIYDDKLDAIMKDSNIIKEKWEHRYQLIDWIENIPKGYVKEYLIHRKQDAIDVTIIRDTSDYNYSNFPYIKQGTILKYAGDEYELESFKHTLIADVATVILVLTKKGEKNV